MCQGPIVCKQKACSLLKSDAPACFCANKYSNTCSDSKGGRYSKHKRRKSRAERCLWCVRRREVKLKRWIQAFVCIAAEWDHHITHDCLENVSHATSLLENVSNERNEGQEAAAVWKSSTLPNMRKETPFTYPPRTLFQFSIAWYN